MVDRNAVLQRSFELMQPPEPYEPKDIAWRPPEPERIDPPIVYRTTVAPPAVAAPYYLTSSDMDNFIAGTGEALGQIRAQLRDQADRDRRAHQRELDELRELLQELRGELSLWRAMNRTQSVPVKGRRR